MCSAQTRPSPRKGRGQTGSGLRAGWLRGEALRANLQGGKGDKDDDTCEHLIIQKKPFIFEPFGDAQSPQSRGLTEKLAVAVVDGEVPQGSRHGSDHAVIAVSQQLCHHGETLLQSDRGPDIPAILGSTDKRQFS